MLYQDRPDLPAAAPPQAAVAKPLSLGLLTFHRCINYGSWWQARCLAEGLAALGHKVTVLDHHDAAIARAELACALQPLLPVPSSLADRRRHARKVRHFRRAQQRLPLSAPFALGTGPAERFDAIVIGSDEVWNPSHPWYGGAGLFWGDGLGEVPLIAHAVSAGHHAGLLPPDRQQSLARFQAIAVRDATTHALVAEATGQSPPVVLDPCLQFPPPPAPPLHRAPYALVYGHDFPDWAGPAVRAWAEAQELQLLSVGYRNAFADAQWLEAGLDGFASAVAGARAMITTMFHGTVFALNAGLPFAAIPSPYRATKLTDLLALVGAQRHLVAEPAGLTSALSAPPGEQTSQTIAALRAASHATLRHALANVPA